MSHTRQEIRQIESYAFTPIALQKKFNPRILFVLGAKPQEYRREISKPEVQNSEEGIVLGEIASSRTLLEFRGPQHGPLQNMRHQVDTDTHIASQLQAEE